MNGNDELDSQYERAVGILVISKRASTSFLQRRLGIGYNAAARLMERAEDEGIVSRPNHVGKREVLATLEPATLTQGQAAKVLPTHILAQEILNRWGPANITQALFPESVPLVKALRTLADAKDDAA